MNNKNLFIVFEGIDGSWKDTQMMRFVENLRDYNKYMQVFITREPSKTTSAGKEIAMKLKKWWFNSAKEALQLYLEDRIERVPLYQSMIDISTIVSSRYEISTYAYQWMQWLSFNEIDTAILNLEDSYNTDIFEPDITFIFDIDEKTVMERIRKRGEALEAFETEKQLKIARDLYLDAAKHLRDNFGRKIYIIDANRPIREIEEEVFNIYSEYIK